MQNTINRHSLDSFDLNSVIIKFKANEEHITQLLNLVDTQDQINKETSTIITKQKINELRSYCQSLAQKDLYNASAEDIEVTIGIYQTLLHAYIQARTKPYTSKDVQAFISKMGDENNSGLHFKHGLAWMPLDGDSIKFSNKNFQLSYELNELEFNLIANSLGLNLMMEDLYEVLEEHNEQVPSNLITDSLGVVSSNFNELRPRLDLLAEIVGQQHSNIYELAFGTEDEYCPPYNGENNIHPAQLQRDQIINHNNVYHFLT